MDRMLDIFPNVDALPNDLSIHLRGMIDCLNEMNLRGPLPRYRYLHNIYEIFDSDGHRRCLFKRFPDDEEQFARKEVTVFLLDHPRDGHRSISSTIYGIAGVLPTIFVRFRNGDEVMMGILMEYAEDMGTVDQLCLYRAVPEEELRNEYLKLILVDIRFAVTDRKWDNIITRFKDNRLQLVPIDHEGSFFDGAGDFTIPGLLWLREKRISGDVGFSPPLVNYIQNLDPNWDLDFLTYCGSEHGVDYAQRFKIFTALLKIGVSHGLNALDMCKIAGSKCAEEAESCNLQVMVDSVERNADFIDNVCTVMDERLRGYHLL